MTNAIVAKGAQTRVITIALVSLLGACSEAAMPSFSPPTTFPNRLVVERWQPGQEATDDTGVVLESSVTRFSATRILRDTATGRFFSVVSAAEPVWPATYPGNTAYFDGTSHKLTYRLDGKWVTKSNPADPTLIPDRDLAAPFHQEVANELAQGLYVTDHSGVACSAGTCGRLVKTESIERPALDLGFMSLPWVDGANARRTEVLFDLATNMIVERKTLLNGTQIERFRVICFDLPGSLRPCPADFYIDEISSEASVASHWRLAEPSGNFANTKAGGPAGTAVGTVSRAVAGALGADQDAALKLNGGMVEIPHATSLEPASLTLEAWVKTDTLADAYPVLEKWSAGVAVTTTRSSDPNLPLSGSGYGLRIASGGALIGFVLNGAGRLDASSPAGAISQGAWTHVAMTSMSSGRIELFVNGERVAVSGSSLQRAIGSAPLRLGGTGGPAALAVRANGLTVDEVSIRSEAVQDYEIREDWATGRGEALI